MASTVTLRTVFAAELLERFAYYGSVFMIPNFATVVLGASQEFANIAVNVVFAVSPLTSVIAFKPADGAFGRPNTLIVGLALYTIGLILLTVAALPSLSDPFPGHPTTIVWTCFYAGIVFLSVGYGAFKTASAPLVSEALDYASTKRAARSHLFMWYSGIVNVGALAGLLISPFLRSVARGSSADPEDGSKDISTAFYVSFAACAAAAFLGLIIVVIMRQTLQCVSCNKRDQPTVCEELSGLVCQSTSDHMQTVQACRVFAVLPFYWLVQNQFMSNVMFQVQWSTLPSSIPPEFFNNINTSSMLLSILGLRALYSLRDRVPAQRARMIAGFVTVGVSIIYCTVLQQLIEHRGYFTDSQDYVLRPGRQFVSAWAFVPQYVASGIASSLIDPTTLEAAFQRAPVRHKSLVMSLYLLAASASGWLGIAFAPLAEPQTISLMYGAMTSILAAAALLWSATAIRDIDCCEGVTA